MNIIEKCSIGGLPFSLSPEAKAILEDYLEKIREYYESNESGAEIVDGIEDRIAELLQEKCGSDKVVSKAEMNEVIGIMGFPEEMGGAEEAAPKEQKKVKRLYRDPRNGVIGGVCSGLAAYFGLDVVIVRLVFVALFALSIIGRNSLVFTVPIIYLVLIIAMPAAKTVQERWAIKGDNGTVKVVEKKVLRGEENVETASRSQFWTRFSRIVGYCIGALLIVIGVAGLVALCVGAFMNPSDWLYPSAFWQDIAGDWTYVFNNGWVMALLFLLAAIPFLGMLWGGIQLCFHLPNPKWHPGLILFLIWIAAAAALVTKILIALIPIHFA